MQESTIQQQHEQQQQQQQQRRRRIRGTHLPRDVTGNDHQVAKERRILVVRFADLRDGLKSASIFGLGLWWWACVRVTRNGLFTSQGGDHWPGRCMCAQVPANVGGAVVVNTFVWHKRRRLPFWE